MTIIYYIYDNYILYHIKRHTVKTPILPLSDYAIYLKNFLVDIGLTQGSIIPPYAAKTKTIDTNR